MRGKFERLYFEDLEVGMTWESAGRTVTEADIVNYAGISGDFNEIHMNEEFAKDTIFGKRIAHGLLGLAIGSGLAQYAPPVHLIAFLGIKEWNFRSPIYIGDTIRVKAMVSEKKPTSKNDRGIIVWKREILNQEDEVVQEGYTIVLVKRREK